ncbi:MAG: hypothetical protein ACT4PI_00060 [Actinomycetota bacterium]
MSRRVRRLGILALVLLLIGTVALVLTGRPRLEDDRSRVDDNWTPLRVPLGMRYDQLVVVLSELDVAGAGKRDVSRELDRELDRWEDLRRSPDDDVDVGAAAAASNRLEALAARAASTVTNSARLSTVPTLVAAVTALGQTLPPADAVRAYNDAAQRYQKTRESLRYTFVARILGYDSRPALVVPTAPAAPA